MIGLDIDYLEIEKMSDNEIRDKIDELNQRMAKYTQKDEEWREKREQERIENRRKKYNPHGCLSSMIRKNEQCMAKVENKIMELQQELKNRKSQE